MFCFQRYVSSSMQRTTPNEIVKQDSEVKHRTAVLFSHWRLMIASVLIAGITMNSLLGVAVQFKRVEQHHALLRLRIMKEVVPKRRRALEIDTMTEFDVGLTSSTGVNNDLVNYLKTMKGGQGSMILLKWAPNGLLQRFTPVDQRGWFSQSSANGPYKQARSSEFGSVAFLLNSDILSWIDWTIIPPIPLLAYTLPNKVENETQFHVIPHPYDLGGFNSFCVWNIEQLVGSEDLSFEEYTSRSNLIVWRGIHHDYEDAVRLDLVRLSKANTEDNKINPSIPKWLDAADVSLEPSRGMEMRDMIKDFRYQIDIGGVSGTSWGGTRWKMCTGAVLFRVDTFSKDWWHNELMPWEHYIPVKEDLSDLHDMYLWAEQNPEQAHAIGQKGRRKCRESLPKEKSEDRLFDILKNLPPATKEMIDDADDVYNNHLYFFTPTSNDKEYNGGYTNNSSW